MRYLLDTHVLLWWVEGIPIDSPADQVLNDFGNDVLVSVISPWEIAIKESKGRLQSPSDLPQLIADSGSTSCLCVGSMRAGSHRFQTIMEIRSIAC